MSNTSLDNIKHLIDLKVQDGCLSEEETKEIIDFTRKEYKDKPLTDDEISNIESYASKKLTQAFNKRRPLTKIAIVMVIVNFIMSFLQLPFVCNALEFAEKYVGMNPNTYMTSVTIILWYTSLVLVGIGVLLDVFTLIFVLKNKPTQAARVLYVSMVKTILLGICATQLFGITWQSLLFVPYFMWQIGFSVYLHPTLSAERLLAKSLLMLSTELGAKKGTLGLAEDPKKGYIKLDFFNLFWVFVIGSIIGLIAEDVFHMIFVWQPGEFHDRAGLLFGPFSPIYGFGALIMTICLNRVYKWNAVIIFIFCTLIGGVFEYFVSWFMEVSFGIVAWDYTNYFLSVNGRTCLLFASMFGLMGMVWIKWGLPIIMKLINKIPWRWRYTVTSICAVLMIVNCLMTLMAFDCWFSRVSGKEPVNFVETFYAEHYNNDWMAKRFESMSIDPSRTEKVN